MSNQNNKINYPYIVYKNREVYCSMMIDRWGNGYHEYYDILGDDLITDYEAIKELDELTKDDLEDEISWFNYFNSYGEN